MATLFNSLICATAAFLIYTCIGLPLTARLAPWPKAVSKARSSASRQSGRHRCPNHRDQPGRCRSVHGERRLLAEPLEPEIKVLFILLDRLGGTDEADVIRVLLGLEDEDDDGNLIENYDLHFYYNHQGEPIYFVHELQNLFFSLRYKELEAVPNGS